MRRFRVNEPDVVFETFDEEIVAVNLETGNYYSLSKTGPQIWMAIAEGCALDEIVENLHSTYLGERAIVAAATTSFLERLISEQLLVEEASPGPTRGPAAALTPSAETRPFESPVIENYSDMQDLLMLDPIHDVDPAGWPVAKTNP